MPQETREICRVERSRASQIACRRGLPPMARRLLWGAFMHRSSFLTLCALHAIALGACGARSDEKASAAPPGASAPLERAPQEIELLNVSYDPTRELWRDLN